MTKNKVFILILTVYPSCYALFLYRYRMLKQCKQTYILHQLSNTKSHSRHRVGERGCFLTVRGGGKNSVSWGYVGKIRVYPWFEVIKTVSHVHSFSESYRGKKDLKNLRVNLISVQTFLFLSSWLLCLLVIQQKYDITIFL